MLSRTGSRWRRRSGCSRGHGSRAGGGRVGAGAHEWTSRMEAAVDDVHAALHWAAENDAELGLTTSAALWRWWLVSGRLAIGRSWLDRFLAGGSGADEATARALSGVAL